MWTNVWNTWTRVRSAVRTSLDRSAVSVPKALSSLTICVTVKVIDSDWSISTSYVVKSNWSSSFYLCLGCGTFWGWSECMRCRLLQMIFPVSVSLCHVVTCDFAMQTWLNGSKSYLGLRLVLSAFSVYWSDWTVINVFHSSLFSEYMYLVGLLYCTYVLLCNRCTINAAIM